MGAYKYSRIAGEDSAKAVGRALPISTKTSKEVCRWIKGRDVAKAIVMLEDVTKMKRAVPYFSAVKDIGHRKGDMRTGGFPQKAATHILDLVKSARHNAEHKGLNSKDLIIWHTSAQQGPHTMRGGRRYRTAKRTHVEIILKEEKKQAKKKEGKSKPSTPKKGEETQ